MVLDLHVNNNVAVTTRNPESRSPTLSTKNSRKISPISQLTNDHAVLRQKFDTGPNRKMTVLSSTQLDNNELCKGFVVTTNTITTFSLNADNRLVKNNNDIWNNHKFSLVEQRKTSEFTPRDTQSLPSSRSFVSANALSYLFGENELKQSVLTQHILCKSFT